MSNSAMGSPLSRPQRSSPSWRSCSSISPHGAKQRSHQISGRSFITPYRMRQPKLDIPISQVSGKHNAQRRSTLLLSLTTALYSPPVYRAGFCTFGRMCSKVRFIFFPPGHIRRGFYCTFFFRCWQVLFRPLKKFGSFALPEAASSQRATIIKVIFPRSRIRRSPIISIPTVHSRSKCALIRSASSGPARRDNVQCRALPPSSLPTGSRLNNASAKLSPAKVSPRWKPQQPRANSRFTPGPARAAAPSCQQFIGLSSTNSAPTAVK